MLASNPIPPATGGQTLAFHLLAIILQVHLWLVKGTVRIIQFWPSLPTTSASIFPATTRQFNRAAYMCKASQFLL